VHGDRPSRYAGARFSGRSGLVPPPGSEQLRRQSRTSKEDGYEEEIISIRSHQGVSLEKRVVSRAAMLGAVEAGGKGPFPRKRGVSLAPISYPVNVSKPDGSMVGIPDMLFPELRVRKR
jgi:hypothetical protein